MARPRKHGHRRPSVSPAVTNINKLVARFYSTRAHVTGTHVAYWPVAIITREASASLELNRYITEEDGNVQTSKGVCLLT